MSKFSSNNNHPIPTHDSPTKASPYTSDLTNKLASTNNGSTTSLHNPPSLNIGPRNGTTLPMPQSTGRPSHQLSNPFPHLNNVESPNTRPVTSDAVPNFYNGTIKTTTYVQCATTRKTTTTSSFAHILVRNSPGTSHFPNSKSASNPYTPIPTSYVLSLLLFNHGTPTSFPQHYHLSIQSPNSKPLDGTYSYMDKFPPAGKNTKQPTSSPQTVKSHPDDGQYNSSNFC